MPYASRPSVSLFCLKRGHWILLCATGLALAFPLSAGDAPTRPNIILILADDLGYEGLGSYGGASYETPRLDRLAATGMQFNHCYSQPICTPSRVQLMTGRYNQRNYEGFGYLNPRETTFGTLLRDAGYATCIAGKWQLNGGGMRGSDPSHEGWDDRHRPFAFGFDEFLLWQVTRRRDEGERYANPRLFQNGNELPADPNSYGPDVFCDFVLDFIERKQDQPFLVYYPMVLPHEPFVPTPATADWEDDSLRYDDQAERFAPMVAYIDRIVGRIVDGLEKAGLRENTLILFTGDNGTHATITSLMRDGRRIAGGKGLMTDAGTRVPLIANWPGRIAAGGVTDDLVDFSDFVPTMLDAAGTVPAPGLAIDGQSFLPRLTGSLYEPRRWVFSHYWGQRGRTPEGAQEFARNQRWKLYDDGRLFDVAADPLEESPVNKEDADAKAARQQLQEAFEIVHGR
jgi:arylsulfatase A